MHHTLKSPNFNPPKTTHGPNNKTTNKWPYNPWGWSRPDLWTPTFPKSAQLSTQLLLVGPTPSPQRTRPSEIKGWIAGLFFGKPMGFQKALLI